MEEAIKAEVKALIDEAVNAIKPQIQALVNEALAAFEADIAALKAAHNATANEYHQV